MLYSSTTISATTTANHQHQNASTATITATRTATRPVTSWHGYCSWGRSKYLRRRRPRCSTSQSYRRGIRRKKHDVHGDHKVACLGAASCVLGAVVFWVQEERFQLEVCKQGTGARSSEPRRSMPFLRITGNLCYGRPQSYLVLGFSGARRVVSRASEGISRAQIYDSLLARILNQVVVYVCELDKRCV